MDAKTKLCCLIGNPVEHSFSPMIHNMLSERMNINMIYTAFRVESSMLEDAVKGAWALGINGLNVTVPHKCAVIPYLSDIDPLAAKIGAVNTLVRSENGFKGYNTDITGLGRQLDEENVTINDNSVIILGAGGASRAITFLCAQKGARKIWLLNRSLSKAETLAREVNGYFGEVVTALPIENFSDLPKGKYPVIQTTSVGLFPDTGCAPIENDDFYEYVSDGVDIIFNPSETEFMKKCRKHGARAHNGLKMLLYQGIAAYELWNNVHVPQETAREILDMMEREIGI